MLEQFDQRIPLLVKACPGVLDFWRVFAALAEAMYPVAYASDHLLVSAAITSTLAKREIPNAFM
jgi:hypothetical protein